MKGSDKMGKTVKKIPDSVIMNRPALTPESEDNEMIALAMKQAKKQLADGTASSQLVTHFVQRGSPEARLRQEKLRKEIELIEAKTKALASAEHIENLFQNAIKAFKGYRGQDDEDEYEDE